MKSNGWAELLDFERDLPTTPEDIVALQRLRGYPRLDFDGYLRFLASLEPPSPEELRSRKGPRGDSRFEL
jgi:hypothetical protein